MPTHYLSYWKPTTAKHELHEADSLLDHAASQQYGRVQPGDVLWICTAWPGGVLTLLGRLPVAAIVPQAEAERRLHRSPLWEADFHVLATPETAEPIRAVDLSDLADRLRFKSKQDRLGVSEGRVDAKQLQTMRELERETVEMFERRWREDSQVGPAISELLGETQSRAGFGDAESNRKVEIAAVDRIKRLMSDQGWKVESVEQQRVGYDLHCSRKGKELHVEVKGTRANWPAFIITEGELTRAVVDNAFLLYVVTAALSTSPGVYRFDQESLLEAFDFEPLAHRAASRSRAAIEAAKLTA